MPSEISNLLTVLALLTALCILCAMLLPRNKWGILLSLYYRKFHTIRSPEPSDIATLVVSNHPNAFIDPFAIETALNIKLVRTVRADWTKHWLVRWFTQAVGAIPLASKSSNKAAFSTLVDTLNSGKAVVLFPEGLSHNRRKLKTFKKGAAHLAKQYIEATGRPIRIVKVALYYENKSKLNSDVWVDVVGESLYTDAQFNVCVETQLWQQEINDALPSYTNSKEKQRINWLLQTLNSADPGALTHLAAVNSKQPNSQLTLLRHWLERAPFNLSTLNMAKKSPLAYLSKSLIQLAVVIIGLPLFLLGALANGFAAIAHYSLVRWQSHAEDKWASNAFILGLCVYPLYWLAIGVMFTPSLALIVILTGLYANFYAQSFPSRLQELRTFLGCLLQPASCADIRHTAQVSLNLHALKPIKTKP